MKVQQQIALMHHSLRYELTPSRVLNATRPPGFTPGLQQDSSEFLGYLLDLLHEHEINSASSAGRNVAAPKTSAAIDDVPAPLSEDIVTSGVIPYNSKDRVLSSGSSSGNCSHKPTPTPPATPTKGTNSLQQQGQPATPTKPPSTIDKTFAGKLSTTYRCLSCGWESRNEDSFRELQLSFPDDKMFFPALRQKAAPVVFRMLSTINQMPEVFHKVKLAQIHVFCTAELTLGFSALRSCLGSP